MPGCPFSVLAGIASRTERLRLASAVTVLSSDDPVRVFERFSTLDALSRGRAEVIMGRGSFTESFPLFGFDLANYQELLEQPTGRVGYHSFGHVAATDEEAAEQYFGPYVSSMSRIGRDRGWRRPI